MRTRQRPQQVSPLRLLSLLSGLWAAGLSWSTGLSWLTRLSRLTGLSRLKGDDDGERGDVPGWVMVTLMTALLVVSLLAIAGPALTKMFNDAISKVGS